MAYRAVAILLAVAPLVFAEQLPVRAYTTTEGLTHNHINRIRQDSRGFLWFATDGGLSRFDGREFTRFTVADGLPHPWANDFIEARDGTYWVATDDGVVQFNPKGISARERKLRAAPPMFHDLWPPGSEQARRINALAEDKDGSLLCATYDGLYRLRRAAGKMEFKKIELGLPSGEVEGYLVNNIAASRRGGWWLAARYGLFRLFEDGRVVRYTLANGLPDDFIETVAEDRSGRIWAGTRGRGFCQIREEVAEDDRIVERCYSVADGLPANDVRAIFQTSEGAFWIGTAAGLSEFHPESAVLPFHNYSGPNGLSDQHILKLAEDSDGNLWIGTMYGGVMEMPREGFVSFREQDGFRTARNQSILETAAGELVIIPEIEARPFIQVFDGRRFQSVNINVPVDLDGFEPLHTGALQDRTGEWWIGTSHGLFRFPRSASVRNLAQLRPKAVYTKAVGFGGNRIEALLEDANGDLWISSNSVAEHGELTQWSRTLGTFHNFADASSLLRESRAYVFEEIASGSLWIGLTHGAGLIRRRWGRFEPLKVPEGTFRGNVEAIHLARSGQLWVATSQGGLVRIENPDSDNPRMTTWTETEGLSSNGVHCITEDQWGRIYVGTDSGVDRLHPATGKVRHFTSADGLERGSVLLAWRDRHGALWFVANAGASRLIPAPDPPPPTRTILISSLRVMGIRYPISVLGETELHGLEVGPGSNEVQVDFGSPEFRPGTQLQYQFELVGADGKWSEATSEQTVRYANLPPGVYRFLARAVNSDGVASSQPASVSFKVQTPFWRRWWFLALAFMCALGSGYAGHHYRVSQLRYHVEQLLAVERIRTRIASDLHDDIGSSLTQVAILSEVVRRWIGEGTPEVNEPLSRIASVSRELVDSMSDIVWALNPAKDKLYYLEQRMREFASDVFTAGDIHFQFRTSNSEHDLPIGAEVRRQVFLIFKECVHNVVRHANCTEVELELRIENKRLVVQVGDNGVRFDPFAAVNGQGLASMRDRSQRLGGRIDFAADDRGTVVTLEVPIG